jgi:FAD/FMN-containing dehydrogenase
LGLASDNLIAAEIVVADGRCSAKVIEASESTNSDLLWACRGGGGGNFGIATSYTLKLHVLSHVEFAIVRWTGRDDLGTILRTWQRDAPVADERLTSALEIDSSAIELSAVMHGGSRDELDAELTSLLAMGKPDVTYMNDSWPTIYQNVDRAPDSRSGSSTPSSSLARSPTRRSTWSSASWRTHPPRRATSSARVSAGLCVTLRQADRRSRTVTRCSTVSLARHGMTRR